MARGPLISSGPHRQPATTQPARGSHRTATTARANPPASQAADTPDGGHRRIHHGPNRALRRVPAREARDRHAWTRTLSRARHRRIATTLCRFCNSRPHRKVEVPLQAHTCGHAAKQRAYRRRRRPVPRRRGRSPDASTPHRRSPFVGDAPPAVRSRGDARPKRRSEATDNGANPGTLEQARCAGPHRPVRPRRRRSAHASTARAHASPEPRSSCAKRSPNSPLRVPPSIHEHPGRST